jgi:hypothetical protein
MKSNQGSNTTCAPFIIGDFGHRPSLPNRRARAEAYIHEDEPVGGK